MQKNTSPSSSIQFDVDVKILIVLTDNSKKQIQVLLGTYRAEGRCATNPCKKVIAFKDSNNWNVLHAEGRSQYWCFTIN